MANNYLRHKIIVGPARKNDPQTIEGALTAELLPGQLVKLDPATGNLVATVKDGQLQAVLMQNSLFGGDILQPVAAGAYGVATMLEGDVDYAVFVTDAVAGIKEGTILYMGVGVLTSVVSADAQPVAVLREDIPGAAITNKTLAKIRKL